MKFITFVNFFRPTLSFHPDQHRSVRSLPPLGPGENFIIAGFADNGAVFGTIGDTEDEEQSSLFSPKRGFRADPNGYFEYPAPINAVSPNGKYVLTVKFVEISPEEARPETALYRNQTLVILAPFPAGVSDLNPPSQVRNDGTVGGTALVGEFGQTFAAGYGYYRSQSSFELIAPPGRPELANAFGITINNSGSATLDFASNTSYMVRDPDGNQNSQQVIAAAFIGKDGSAVEITNGNPNTGISVSGITDSDVVFGTYDTQSDPDLLPHGEFIFSPRSGFRKFEDIVPGADEGWLYQINAANHALIGTTEGLVIVELPRDL